MTDISIESASAADLAEIVRNFDRFWGDAENELLRHLHHPMFILEFGDTAFVARRRNSDEGAGGEIVGYLLGFLAPAGYGYVHFIAVRDDARTEGLASRLYERFTSAALERGATGLKAITSPENERSIAFHRRLGFTDMERVEDYGGSDRPRIIMRKPLVISPLPPRKP
jgi:ribosomal protein S18 acetylase RimI-like enzyme